MMRYNKGDIVLVNFNPQRKPQEVGKTRPAVVVSDTDLNEILDLVTVIPLTSNIICDALPLRIPIAPKQNLQKRSDAMVENIRAIAKSRIVQKLGNTTQKELSLIEEGLLTLFDLKNT